MKPSPLQVLVKGGRETVLWLCGENNVDTSWIEVDGEAKKGAAIMADISELDRAVRNILECCEML